MIEFKDPVAEHIKTFILDETALQIENREYASDPVWKNLRDQGSRIWLQGCDHRAAEVWSSDMEAICADTRQLGAAVRRGEYDRLIDESTGILKGLPERERVAETAFIISARHAVKLSKRFAAKVSVEIPCLPGGHEEMLQYGRRLFQICPEHILIALPYSREGLAAAAELRRCGVPVTIRNLFDLSQMLISHETAAPAYLAVDLEGRPDKAVEILHRFADEEQNRHTPRLIAEGIENAEEVELLTGFPILKLSPDAALRFRGARNGPAAGAADPGPGTRGGWKEGTGSAADALSSQRLQRQNSAYRKLQEAVSKAISPN